MSRLDRNIEITCNFETINIPPSAPLKYLVHPILQDNIDGVHWGLFYGALDRSRNKKIQGHRPYGFNFSVAIAT